MSTKYRLKFGVFGIEDRLTFEQISALSYAHIFKGERHIELPKSLVENNPQWFEKVEEYKHQMYPDWVQEGLDRIEKIKSEFKYYKKHQSEKLYTENDMREARIDAFNAARSWKAYRDGDARDMLKALTEATKFLDYIDAENYLQSLNEKR